MKKIGLVFGALIWLLMLIGCSMLNPSEQEPLIAPATSPVPTSEIQNKYVKLAQEEAQNAERYVKLSPEEAQTMIEDQIMNDIIILDVSTQGEYDEGHIVNAILLPDYEIKERVENVAPDKALIILVYCQTGIRSERISNELIDLGYENVYDLGGIVDWTEKIVGSGKHPAYYNYFGETLPPDIVIPIDYTITTKIATPKISNQMPEYTFHLTGNSIKHYGVSDDDTKRYIMFYENIIEYITITDKMGGVVQKIDGIVTSNPASEEEMYGLSFADWNFDGYLDIDLLASPGFSTRSDSHYYWLWDNSLGQFAKNVELTELSSFFSLSINIEEEWINCFTQHRSMSNYLDQYLSYRDGKFEPVCFVISKVEPSPVGEDINLRHVITEEIVDGKMIITGNDYYDIEK